MKQPVAGPLGSPRHRHRRCRREELRHDRMPIGGSDGRVPRTVADAVNLEVEAVQVHGMRLRAQVDHAPARRLADAIRQALGRRPGEAVDHEREARLQPDEDLPGIVGAHHLAELRRRQADPLGDDEHPIVGRSRHADRRPARRPAHGRAPAPRSSWPSSDTCRVDRFGTAPGGCRAAGLPAAGRRRHRGRTGRAPAAARPGRCEASRR